MSSQGKQEWQWERVAPDDEAGFDEYFDLTAAVFGAPAPDRDQGFLDIFYPNGYDAEVRSWLRATQLSSIKSPDTHYLLVRDHSAPGTPAIAAAKWQYIPAKTDADFQREEAEAAEKRVADRAKAPSVLHDRLEVFRIAQKGGKWEHLRGRAHWYLNVLAVRTDHQRKGLGTYLLGYGLGRADEAGLETYLEGSPAGKKLYEDHGFEVRGLLDWDARQFEGIRYPFTNYAMVRPAQQAKTA